MLQLHLRVREFLILEKGFALTRLELTRGAKSHLFGWLFLQEGEHFDPVSAIFKILQSDPVSEHLAMEKQVDKDTTYFFF